MKKYGVQAYIDGHDHSMQYISYEGIEYMVQGTGSLTKDHLPKGRSDAADGVEFASLSPGFGAALVTSDFVDVSYVGSSGEKLFAKRLLNPRHVQTNLRSPSAEPFPDIAMKSRETHYALALFIAVFLLLVFVLTRTWKSLLRRSDQYRELP